MLLNRVSNDYQPPSMSVLPAAPVSREMAFRQFEHLDVRYDSALHTCWASLLIGQSGGRATRRLMSDLQDMHANLHTVAAARIAAGQDPMQYFVLGSHVPSIFNLGGDIVFFANRIRAG